MNEEEAWEAWKARAAKEEPRALAAAIDAGNGTFFATHTHASMATICTADAMKSMELEAAPASVAVMRRALETLEWACEYEPNCKWGLIGAIAALRAHLEPKP